MAQELDSLLERIQKDGVEKAQAEAESIRSAAKEEATRIREEARQEAEAIVREAKENGETFTERGVQAVKQAARDTILGVGGAVETIIRDLVSEEVSGAIDPETLRRMIVEVVTAYAERGGDEQAIEVLLNDTQVEAIQQAFASGLADKLKAGVEVKPDRTVKSGFRISVSGETVEHDFTADAIAETLSGLLRPKLAEIVRRAAAEGTAGSGQGDG